MIKISIIINITASIMIIVIIMMVMTIMIIIMKIMKVMIIMIIIIIQSIDDEIKARNNKILKVEKKAKSSVYSLLRETSKKNLFAF